jgi:AraC-like DNA-binding protein
MVLLNAEPVSMMLQFLWLLNDADSMLPRESIFTSMLATLLMRYGDRPPTLRHVGSQAKAISRVCEYIKAHFAQNQSLEELAGVACLSPFHFHRLFVTNTGSSPHEYLIQVRIKKARELLLEGNCIADVALDAGFGDQSHFTRFFKRVVGIAPRRFVQLHTQSS